jgi:hypothetical protein
MDVTSNSAEGLIPPPHTLGLKGGRTSSTDTTTSTASTSSSGKSAVSLLYRVPDLEGLNYDHQNNVEQPQPQWRMHSSLELLDFQSNIVLERSLVGSDNSNSGSTSVHDTEEGSATAVPMMEEPQNDGVVETFLKQFRYDPSP